MTAARPIVLIVDDETSIHSVFEVALEDSNCVVEVADSGEAAWEMFAPGKYAAVVLDKNLPGISGVNLLGKIRAVNADVGCLLMTGYASRKSAFETMELGIDGYLEKPFADMNVVVARIEAMLSPRPRRDRHALNQACHHFRTAVELVHKDRAQASLSVLVASADADVTNLVRAEFASAEVSVAITTGSAMEALHGHSPTLMVIDADTARDELVGFVRRVRDTCPATPLLVIHRMCPLPLALELIDLGVRAIFDKPLNRREFVDRFRRIVPR